MASLHTHRKLLAANSPDSNFTVTTDDPTVQTCLYFCNTQRNYTLPYTGFCPQACLAFCPSLCHYSLSDLPLTPDFSSSKPNKSHNLSPVLICMLILLATIFLLITLYVIYTKLCYSFYAPHSNSILQTRSRRRRRRREGAESYSLDEEHRRRMVFHPFWYIPTVGLPPTAISSIPVQKYGKEVEEQDCAVCLAEFEEGDELRVLPKCSHAFHITCIDTWLSSHTTCPLCRVPIIPPNHDQDHNYHHKNDEDTSSSLTSVEGAAENNSQTEVLSINVISGEESVQVANTMEMENTIENIPDKDQQTLGSANEGSCSQTWSLERGAANLLSRSLSCSGKIFSSRSNIRPSPNS